MTIPALRDTLVQETLARWLAEQGELFARIHYPHSGSSSDDYFLRSPGQIGDLCATLPPNAVLIAYRERQFPLRIVVTEQAMPEIARFLPEGQWYAIVALHAYPQRIVSYGSGSTREELLADLADVQGMECGIGLGPIEPEFYWQQQTGDGWLVARQRE